jgi:hypothetical protein
VYSLSKTQLNKLSSPIWKSLIRLALQQLDTYGKTLFYMIFMVHPSCKHHAEKPTIHAYISPFQFSTIKEGMKQLSECLMWTETHGRGRCSDRTIKDKEVCSNADDRVSAHPISTGSNIPSCHNQAFSLNSTPKTTYCYVMLILAIFQAQKAITQGSSYIYICI